MICAGGITVRRSLEEVRGKLRLKEPKSAGGRRKIDRPQNAIDALHEHGRRMMAEGHAGVSFVFCDHRRGRLRKSNVERRDCKPLRKKAGIRPVRFHHLRHTHATLLLSQGVNAKVVAQRLGHANIAVTSSVYRHVLPSMQRDPVAKRNVLFAVETA